MHHSVIYSIGIMREWRSYLIFCVNCCCDQIKWTFANQSRVALFVCMETVVADHSGTVILYHTH